MKGTWPNASPYPRPKDNAKLISSSGFIVKLIVSYTLFRLVPCKYCKTFILVSSKVDRNEGNSNNKKKNLEPKLW